MTKPITTPHQLLTEWVQMISNAERCYYPNGIGYRLSFNEGQLAYAHKVLENDEQQTTRNKYWEGWNDAMDRAGTFFKGLHSERPLGKFDGKFCETQLKGMKAILDENGQKIIEDFRGEDLNHADRKSGPP